MPCLSANAKAFQPPLQRGLSGVVINKRLLVQKHKVACAKRPRSFERICSSGNDVQNTALSLNLHESHHFFSHACRLWELQSSCSTLRLPLASAFLSRSSTHACREVPSFCQSVLEEPKGEYFGYWRCFLRVLPLEFLSSLRSQSRLPLEQLSRFFLVLEPLSLLRAFSPTVLFSPKILKLHVLELGSHRDFVLVSCFDEEAQRLVSQLVVLHGTFRSSWRSSDLLEEDRV